MKQMIREYKKCSWALPLALLVNISCLRPNEDGDLIGTLNDFFLKSFCDMRSYEAGKFVLVLSFMSMSYLLIFAILCGMDIYKEMYSTGIYTMVRVKSKKRWIGSLIGKLAGKSLLFSVLFAAMTWVLNAHYTGKPADGTSIYAFAFAVLSMFVASFLVALLMNFFSIVFDMKVGVFVGVFVFLIMILYLAAYPHIPVLNQHDLMWLDPVYLCNLFYEENMRTTLMILLYDTGIFTVLIGIFIWRADAQDIRLMEEDI